jgi:GT2 family glycosyltransferase
MNTHASKVLLDTPIETPLALGNRAMRAGDYGTAIDYYLKALEERSELSRMIEGNLELARSRCVAFDMKNKSLYSDKVIYFLDGVKNEEIVESFDNHWYFQQNQDLDHKEINAWQHYLYHGYSEGRRARFFDVRRYLEQNPDLINEEKNLWHHYDAFGKDEARQAPFFHPQVYLQLNPDLQGHNLEPFEHYLIHGRSEGRKAYLQDVHRQFPEIMLNKNKHYKLVNEVPGYQYIPTRKPYNLIESINKMDNNPVFSILVPLYNTPPELLIKVIDSVKSQWYPYWELILADDASPSVHVKQNLALVNDERIKIMYLESNQGIAGATNSALSVASGEYIVLLDHDDELTDDCLYELALCINQESPDYIYSDEDKINSEGFYIDPHFKPDWSPDTMMSTMYVCHVSCIRRSLLIEVQGLRSDYDGCQDWDLILRLTEKTQRISHIPKVLYHWRIIPGSIAADIEAKSYVLDASKRVREDALKRLKLSGTVEQLDIPGYFRVNYHPQNNPLISIIIPTRDNAPILKQCIDSIQGKTRYRNFELIILDNGSVKFDTIKYLKTLQKLPNVSIIRHDAPFNFSELNNIGVTHSKGEILLFLNDDTEVISEEWLERMAGYAQLKHIGAVGAKLLYPGDRSIQHAGVINLADGPGHAFLQCTENAPAYYMRGLLEYNWLAVTGACLMIERQKFENVGGFDVTFPIAYNDIELCFRLVNNKYFNVVCQAVKLIHHESVSRGIDHIDLAKTQRLEQEKRRLYYNHPHFLQYDPFFNSNLHPNGINFNFVWQ